MWGQKWGQMIWGAPPSVPAIGSWLVLLLAAALILVGLRRFHARPRTTGLVALLLALAVPLTARAIGLPFTFTNGTIADATQVNANFGALAGQQGLNPAASSALVDLVTTASCGTGLNAGQMLSTRVLPDGTNVGFVIEAGQTFVVTEIDVTMAAGASAAGRAVQVRIGRTTVDASGVATGLGAVVESNVLTLDARGQGNVRLSYGAGSAYGPGTAICISVLDIAGGFALGQFPTAHGFTTTQ